MKARYRTTVQARELPTRWREEGQFAPDDQVIVSIEPVDVEPAKGEALLETMNAIGRRAQQRGLTAEKLQEILDAAS